MPPSGAIATMTEPGSAVRACSQRDRDGQTGRRAEQQRLLRGETVDGLVDGSVVDVRTSSTRSRSKVVGQNSRGQLVPTPSTTIGPGAPPA